MNQMFLISDAVLDDSIDLSNAGSRIEFGLRNYVLCNV
jgi:hypothetical protein